MENRKIASFTVNPQIIADALHLPDGYTILGGEWDFISNEMRLFVEGPGLPDHRPGTQAKSIVPLVTVTVDDEGRRQYSWEWPENAGSPHRLMREKTV